MLHFFPLVFSHVNSIQSAHHFGPDRHIPTTTGWIAVKFFTDIHGPRRMNLKDFSYPNFSYSSTMRLTSVFSPNNEYACCGYFKK